MFKNISFKSLLATVCIGIFVTAEATRPDAPALATRGPHKIGVKTIELEDSSRKRNLKLEVWYPASLTANQPERDQYKTNVGATKVTIVGQAARDAKPETGKFPLIFVSHGQPGNRFALTYLTEHMASQGFVVAAIDHTNSTYNDVSQESYVKSLVDRPQDILSGMNEIPKQFANADPQNIGLVGYSYGGYSVLNAAGISLSKKNLQSYCTASNNEGPCFVLPFFDALESVRGANIKPDPRIKAVMALAPYGGPWLSPESLAKNKTPLFIGCGEDDDIALCKRDSQSIYEYSGATSYFLKLAGARHNPWVNPAPTETRANAEDFERWSEPVWDKERTNDVTKHFATAFFSANLLNNSKARSYLESNLPSFGPRVKVGITLQVKP